MKLSVALYVQPGGCATYATLSDGKTITPLFAMRGEAGQGWRILADSLELSAPADELAIFTNIKIVADILTPEPTRIGRQLRGCVKPPKPTKFSNHKSFKGVGYGGDLNHWRVLRSFAKYGSRWRVRYVSDMAVPMRIYQNVEPAESVQFVPLDRVEDLGRVPESLDDLESMEY